MTHADIISQRLVNQHLIKADQPSPLEVVRNLVALQAQDYPGVLWSIALRMPEPSLAAVEAAIAERQIVRTWPMRGTLHFVAAEDIRWLLQLLTPRMISGSASRRRNLELDDATLAKAHTVVAKALTGKVMLRSELLSLLDAQGISTANQRGYHILFHLSMQGIICFGPHNAKQPTFVLLDEWIPKSRELDHDAALAELTRRFFTGHGPATDADLARWAGLPLGEVRRGREVAGSALRSLEVDGQVFWTASDASEHTPQAFVRTVTSALLLPGFDEYVLGYKDRSLMLEQLHSQKIVPGNNGMFMPTIVVNGQIVGTWKRTIKPTAVVIGLQPFDRLNAADLKAVAAAADRYGAFLGKQPTVAFA